MYIGDESLYRIFDMLRRHDVPLGISEYRDALRILRSGNWIGETGSADHLARLQRMLGLLWAKSEEDANHLAELFGRHFTLLAEPATSESAGGKARHTGDGESKTPHEIGLSQVVTGKPADDEPADATCGPMGDSRYDFSDIGGKTFRLTPHYPVSRRRMSGSFRRLRRMKLEGVSGKPDIPGTIRHICRRGCFIRPVFARERRNQTDLLLLVDRQGSMDPFSPLVKTLINSILQGGMLRNVGICYFQNCPQAMVFEKEGLTDPVPVSSVITEKLENHAVLIVSDAGAARGYYQENRVRDTAKFLKRIGRCAHCCVWLNPVPKDRWAATSAAAIAAIVQMFPFDREGLDAAVNALRQ